MYNLYCLGEAQMKRNAEAETTPAPFRKSSVSWNRAQSRPMRKMESQRHEGAATRQHTH